MSDNQILLKKLRRWIFGIGILSVTLGAVAVFVLGEGGLSAAVVPILLLLWLVLMILIGWYFVVMIRQWL